jgi:hypothetical protein
MKSKLIISIELLLSITLSIYLASLDNILLSNYSIIGNNQNYHLYFVSWGLITNLYFFTVLFKYFSYDKLLLVSFISGFGAILIPFIPNGNYIISNIHIMMGFVCFVTYTYNIARLILLVKMMNYNFSDKIINFSKVILFILALIIAYFMQVNSLIETIYCIAVDIILYFIYLNINVKINLNGD